MQLENPWDTVGRGKQSGDKEQMGNVLILCVHESCSLSHYLRQQEDESPHKCTEMKADWNSESAIAIHLGEPSRRF